MATLVSRPPPPHLLPCLRSLVHIPTGQWPSWPTETVISRCAVPPPCPSTLQPGNRVEFVINDGGSDWDSPNPWGEEGR